MSKPNLVIGISAYSGGGKSAVADQLATILDKATVIHTDDYDVFSTLPNDYGQWLRNGAPQSAISRPLLAQHMASLRAGAPITHPITRDIIYPTPFIVFDCPDGRSPDFADSIDLMVFLDTSLDVAMARRILRDYFSGSQTLTPEQSQALHADLKGYLGYARAAYLQMDIAVKPGCDLILDGTESINALAKEIATHARLIMNTRQ